MGTEEYAQKRKELLAELSALNALFIDTNKPCKEGQKIDVRDGNKRVLGVVTGFKIDHFNEIRIIAKKLKKDGTASEITLSIWNDSDVKYIN